MKTQIRQVLFLAIFGMICTIFVIFVPWGSNSKETGEPPASQAENSNSTSGNFVEKQNFATETLSIALKNWLLSDNLLNFSKKFTETHWWVIAFLTWEKSSDADLSLIAFDEFTGIKADEVRFQEDITPLFVPWLGDFIVQYPDFLPVAFDPAVMIGLSGLQAGLEGLELTFSEWNPRSNLSSFSFWLFDDPSLDDQNLLLAQQIEDFVRFNDVGAFSQRVERNKLSSAQQKKLLELRDGFTEPHPLLLHRLIGIEFGFYSALSSENSGSNSSFSIQLYPYQYIGLPVRLYGFVINPKSEHRKMADQFLLDYMDGAFGKEKKSLMSRMLPVFRNQFSESCGENSCGLPSDFVILKDSKAKIQKFLNDRLLLKTIEKKVQPDLYLKNASL